MYDTPEVQQAIRKAARKRQLDVTFLEVARSLAKLSHCRSFKVGAVLVKDGRILSTGYNGTPPGQVNCDDIFPDRADPAFDREKHHQWSNLHEIHAEANTLLWAAREGISVNGATLYCTTQPCDQCVKLLSMSGVVRVVYGEIYDKCTQDNPLLRDSGIVFEHIS